MGNRMAMVWTDRAGRMSSAPSRPSRPRSPRSRLPKPSATSSVANTSPSRTSQATALHRRSGPGESDVEADLEHVAVDDLVILALHPQLPGLLGFVPRAQLEQLVPADDLGPDETPLQVGVDDARAFGGLGARPERPRPALFVAGREEGPPAEQVVGGSGHARQGPLAEAEAFQQFGAFVLGHLGGLGLQLDAHTQHLGGVAQLVGD